MDNYQGLGLIASSTLVLSVSILLWRSAIDHGKSISQHAAVTKGSFIVFGVASTFSAALLYLFMDQWFVPAHALPAAFGYILLWGVFCQLVAAWVPDNADGRLPSRIHGFFAYAMAATMPVLMVLLATADGVSVVGRVISSAIGALMVLYAILAVTIPRLHARYLVHQIIYIFAFYGAILVVTYT